ncbi:MAG: cellulose synthase [Bauldia sp.]|uniref:cellulose synthase n=1 Tax=Bauldia sp. TaxID=2575872 RepID=UPI001D6FFADE|nr:cellulose synthase [Bauldia sp.]MCB1495554.1 cellulose synthase [Bauldia sp.]
MSVKTLVQLVVVAGVATWIVTEGLMPPTPPGVDDLTTGAIGTAIPSARRTDAGPLVITQAMPDELPRNTQLNSPGTASPPPTDRRSGDVDESALRYFARQGDARRLEAEIARLRAIYPGWQPPADPLAPVDYADHELDRMWQLFSEGRYAEVRAAIADRRKKEPQWQPPDALVQLLDQTDTRIRLTNASDAKQWGAVVDIAAKTPSLLTCDYVDVLWRVAEAFANTDRPNRAEDAYAYILANCDNPQERLATIRKAVALLPEKDSDTLFTFERGDEFAAARDDQIRRRVGKIAETEEGLADPADLTRLEDLARAAADSGDPALLGWYYYRRDKPGVALDWFTDARERAPESAKAAEGYALSLNQLDRFAEAETFGYDWADATEDNLAAYLGSVVGLLSMDPPPRVSESTLERIVSVVVKARDPAAGEQLGWYAYNLKQIKTATRWFETVLRWDPEDESAAYGLAVTRLALKDRTGANVVIREWADRSERIAKLGKPGSRTELRGPNYTIDAPVYDEGGIVRTPVRRTAAPAAAPARCGGSAPVNTLTPTQALPRGWCLMDLNRPVEAAAAFEIAMRSPNAKVRSDAAYGASLANLRSGVTDKAAVAAASAPQSSKRQTELMTSVLTQQALALYAEGRYAETILALDARNQYAQEQNDLLVLRGWAYLKMRRYADARRIFQAAAGTGSPDAIRGLAEVQAAQSGLR